MAASGFTAKGATKGCIARRHVERKSCFSTPNSTCHPETLTHWNAPGHVKPEMDTLGIEPRASRMLSGCDTTTPCAQLIITDVTCKTATLTQEWLSQLCVFCFAAAPRRAWWLVFSSRVGASDPTLWLHAAVAAEGWRGGGVRGSRGRGRGMRTQA